MRTLPFPSEPAFAREVSYEYGTPASNTDDIPIDPALAGPPIDPALQHWPDASPNEHDPYYAAGPPPPFSPHRRDYSQGPQGDPFAPAPPPPYFPQDEQATPVFKQPVKKKRRPTRQKDCSFCGGTEKKNPKGVPERHPSCLHVAEIAEGLRQYPWTCLECKVCEICHEKGDDDRLLFCDLCDRGWHMDCLNPPIEESPPGKWHCPICSGMPSGLCGPSEEQRESQVPSDAETQEDRRESSVASSSRSQLQAPHKSRKKWKGKHRAVTTDESELDADGEVDVDVDDFDTPVAGPRERSRRKTYASRKKRAAEGASPSPTATPTSTRGPRLKIKAPKSMIVRLRLPPQGKGKEKETDGTSDDEPKGMFDDLLTPEESDTRKTTIASTDVARFEKARDAAEARLAPVKPPPIVPDTPMPGPSVRPLRSAAHLMSTAPLTPGLGRSLSPTPSTPATPGGAPSAKNPALRIRTIRFGSFDIQTWYDAPFPEEYANVPDGRLWICYLLSKKEQRAGSPEKPLSGLGALGYRNYWTLALMRYLKTAPDNPRLEDISRATCMTIEDIYNTLEEQGMIDVYAHQSPPKPKPLPGQSIKFPRGRKNGVARRHLIRTQTQDDDVNKGPFVPPSRYKISWDRGHVEEYLARWEAKGYFKINPEKLKWTPFLLSRTKADEPEGAGMEVVPAVLPVPSAAEEVAEDSAAEDSDMPMSVVELPGPAVDETPQNHVPNPDPDPEIATPSARRLRTSCSPSKRTMHIPDAPPSLATRRLRSQAHISTTVFPSPSPTTQHTNGMRRTRSSSSRVVTPLKANLRSQKQAQAALINMKDTLDADAALAQKLAEEEMHPRRMLRSRSNTGLTAGRSSGPAAGRELKRSLSASSRSVKKRRRVDTSPEPEPESEPEMEPDPDKDDDAYEDADAEADANADGEDEDKVDGKQR
ncbi:hypothetical protein EWM64_g8421, partial [Hericium alpestre]